MGGDHVWVSQISIVLSAPRVGLHGPASTIVLATLCKKRNPRLLLCQTRLEKSDEFLTEEVRHHPLKVEHRFSLQAPHHNSYQSSTSQSSRDFNCSLARTRLDVPFDPARQQGLHLLLLKFTWLGNHWGPCPSSLGNNAGASTGRTDDDNGRLS